MSRDATPGITGSAHRLHRDDHQPFPARRLDPPGRAPAPDRSPSSWDWLRRSPLTFRRHDWLSISLTWPALTSGITRRNIGRHAQRARIGDDRAACLRELRLQFGSDRGIERGENYLRGTRRGGRRDNHPRNLSGTAVFSFQRAASPYGRPSERSDAASHATSNQGWCSSIWTKRCPTMPVAPRMPTGIFVCMMLLDFTTPVRKTCYERPTQSLLTVRPRLTFCFGTKCFGR